MKGLFSCHQLTDLTIGICETMTDFELIATVRACPDLHTLRLIDCGHITERGLSGAAQAGSAITSLSLCFLKPALGVLLESVRPLSGSVTALRLMVNRGANSLRGLCGWGQLSRLELTLSCPVPAGERSSCIYVLQTNFLWARSGLQFQTRPKKWRRPWLWFSEIKKLVAAFTLYRLWRCKWLEHVIRILLV